MRRYFAFVVASLRMLVRNRQNVNAIVLSPIIIMLLFGYAFTSGSFLVVPVGVVDRDQSELSRALIQRLENTRYLRVRPGTRSEELTALARGDRRLVVVIPPGFSAAATGFPTELEVSLDGGDLENSRLALQLLQGALTDTQAAAEQIVTVSARTVGQKKVKVGFLEFLVPGLFGLGIQNVALVGSVGTLADYKTRGILRRVRTTPMPLWTFISGTATISLLIGTVQFIVLFSVAFAVFHLHVTGSPLALFTLVVIGNAVFVALATIVSSVANGFRSAQLAANAIGLVMTVFSGVFLQTEIFPRFLQPLIRVLPLTHLVRGFRNVVTRGAGFAGLSHELLVLAILGVVLYAAAIVLFRWE